MLDVEKVIKGLEICTTAMDAVRCPECPYKPLGGLCKLAMMRDAIALLKAQEPVRPIPGLWDRDIQLFNCGACGGEIGAGGIAKYCMKCGQAVKWE